VLQYLRTLPALGETRLEALRQKIGSLDKPVVTKADWQRLETEEQALAKARGLSEFKFDSNAAMLAAIGLGQPAPGD
jgi:hypothetical protein